MRPLPLLALALAVGGAALGLSPGQPPPRPAPPLRLVEARVDALPPGANWAGIERTTLAPGVAMPLGTAADDGRGAYLFVVEIGSIAFEVDGPAMVTRAGSPAIAVAAGGSPVLRPGDAGFVPTDTTARWRAVGDGPAAVLQFSLTGPGSSRQPAGVEHRTLVQDVSAAPATPVDAALWRVVVPPGDVLPVAAMSGAQMLALETGALVVERPPPTGGRALVPAGIADLGPGAFPGAVLLANPGPGALILLVATVRRSPLGTPGPAGP